MAVDLCAGGGRGPDEVPTETKKGRTKQSLRRLRQRSEKERNAPCVIRGEREREGKCFLYGGEPSRVAGMSRSREVRRLLSASLGGEVTLLRTPEGDGGNRTGEERGTLDYLCQGEREVGGRSLTIHFHEKRGREDRIDGGVHWGKTGATQRRPLSLRDERRGGRKKCGG